MSLAGWLVGNAVGQVCYRSNLAEKAKNNWMTKKERKKRKEKTDRQTDNRGFRNEMHVFPRLEREIRKYCKIERERGREWSTSRIATDLGLCFPAWMDLSYRLGMAMFVWLQVACI